MTTIPQAFQNSRKKWVLIRKAYIQILLLIFLGGNLCYLISWGRLETEDGLASEVWRQHHQNFYLGSPSRAFIKTTLLSMSYTRKRQK